MPDGHSARTTWAAILTHAQGCRWRRFERGARLLGTGLPSDSFQLVVVRQERPVVIAPSRQQEVIEPISPGAGLAEAPMFLSKPGLANA